MSPGRIAGAEIAFSTAGTSSRSRKSSPSPITMSARPMAVAAPPMSFFMIPMEAGGLMSSPPVSKQTPLPTSVTFGASARPQTRSSSRGGSEAAAPTASIIGRLAARSAALPRVTRTSAPCRPASATKAASSASGPMSRAGVLIEILRQRRRSGDPRHPRAVDAVGADEFGHGRLCGAVAAEAIVGEEPAQRLQRGVDLDALGNERIAPGGKPGGGRREREAVAPAGGGGAPAGQRRLHRAVRPRQAEDLADAGREPHALDPGPRRRVLAGQPVRQAVGSDQAERNGPGVGRGGQRHARDTLSGNRAATLHARRGSATRPIDRRRE